MDSEDSDVVISDENKGTKKTRQKSIFEQEEGLHRELQLESKKRTLYDQNNKPDLSID